MLRNSFIRYFLIAAILFSPALFFHSRQVFLLYPAEVFLYMFILEALENINKKAFLLFNIVAITLTLIFTSYGIVTGMPIGYQVVASIFETNFSEAFEFTASSFFLKILFVYISLFLFSLYLLFYPKGITDPLYRQKKVLYLSLALFLIYPFHFYNKFDYYPENVIKMFYRYIGSIHKRVQMYKSANYRFVGETDHNKKTNLILVIGEASRKYSYSLYGYHRDTNPLLQKKRGNMILFDHAYTVAPYTRIAVPSLLSTASVKEFSSIYDYPTLIRIYNSLDIPTTVLSNQTINLDSDIFISAIFEEAGKRYFLQNQNNGYFDKILYDEQLLNELEKNINSDKNKNSLIIIHLMGSHYKYKNRYPENRKFFLSDTIRDHYDNSIRYTDFILFEINELIRKQNKPYAILYVSDHGEYLNEFKDGIYGHGVKDITYYELEIPFIFFYNDKFGQLRSKELRNLIKHKNKKISLDNVSHTLLGLSGIYPVSYDESFDLSSDKFSEHQRYIIMHDMEVNRADRIKIRTK